ncbi:MAG: nucleotidyltransferase [Verrucomicrobia bacterium]|nr:MAG: nucleotidyltransferase [Verrucomicrobiota bacterium]
MPNKVENKEQVLQCIRASKEKIEALGVQRMGLFGSFATGKQTAKSDVDIFVDFVPSQHTFDNFMDLSFLLERLFGRDVELVTPESLGPYMGPHILEEVELVLFAA